MKLWDKGIKLDKLIEDFSIGKDRELDVYLAKHDVLGSLAHVRMLSSIGLITGEELKVLLKELIVLYHQIEEGNFLIDEGIEDVHSQIEFILTNKLGETGKKIHSGRSRNDQIALDIKLFTRDNLQIIVEEVEKMVNLLIHQSELYKDILMPGYTHLQVAMPSSFGLWFASYAESLCDDMQVLLSAYKIANQNPLGSAAGYGSSLPLNRQMTTDLLGFDNLNYNVVYAQMSRVKTEKMTVFSLASVASTLSKLATDACLYMSQNFNFINLPEELTTGSSIMPHKKNPDVFELIRAKCNKIQAMTNEITIITNNLPSGYFRDMQIVKETFIPAFKYLYQCLKTMQYVIEKIIINKKILEDKKYKYIFSVEEVNRLVMAKIPFRDAYKKVSESIKEDTFKTDIKIHYTHEGSIGNLCNDKIFEKFYRIKKEFPFEYVNQKINELLTINNSEYEPFR